MANFFRYKAKQKKIGQIRVHEQSMKGYNYTGNGEIEEMKK